jgi:hypothetical protein
MLRRKSFGSLGASRCPLREEPDEEEDDEEDEGNVTDDEGDDDEEDDGGYSVRVWPFVSVVKDEARRFRQGCRRDLGFAAGRVPQPHPERRGSRRGFSAEPITPPAGAEEAIASRHLSRRSCDEQERLQPPRGTGSHRALSEEY